MVPCKDCKWRVVGCHSVCTRYTDYKAELFKIQEKQREQLDADRHSPVDHKVKDKGIQKIRRSGNGMYKLW